MSKPTQVSADPTGNSSLPQTAPNITINNLVYKFPNGTPGLKNFNLNLPPKSRTLLIGANGAGKTTLLRLLAGKHLAPNGDIRIGGVDPFKEGLEGVTYLGLEWVLNPIVRTDISVTELLNSVGGTFYPERRAHLIKILDIDETWRMSMCSDGERRRVQLAMGLLRPWSILLLDEVTVDLDVLARARFLDFLKTETETRECTVVYATHVMDGLGGWPSHLVRLTLGECRFFGSMEEVEARWGQQVIQEEGGKKLRVWERNSGLLEVVLKWLREDIEERGQRGIGPKQVGRDEDDGLHY